VEEPDNLFRGNSGAIKLHDHIFATKSEEFAIVRTGKYGGRNAFSRNASPRYTELYA